MHLLIHYTDTALIEFSDAAVAETREVSEDHAKERARTSEVTFVQMDEVGGVS